jgi:general secretion pathway protein K
MSRSEMNQAKNGGFALLVVILVMLITSFLASQLILKVRTDLKISTNIQQRLVGRMLAEGGVNLALFRLIDKPDLEYEEKLDGAIFLGGRSYETVLSTGKMEYYAVSESGKIDLNRSHNDLLRKFFVYQGLDDEEADIVLDSILDWRDEDELYRVNGAEGEYYEEEGFAYIPRNGKIEDPAEFFLIRGTESLKGRFDPYDFFTVNNSDGKLNINNLSPVMLSFLVNDDADLIGKFREEQDLSVSGRLSKTILKGIVDDGIYGTLGVHLADSANVSKIYSIVANGYAGDFSLKELDNQGEIKSAGQETQLENSESVSQASHSTQVSVLVEISENEFKYLSWREQYI